MPVNETETARSIVINPGVVVEPVITYVRLKKTVVQAFSPLVEERKDIRRRRAGDIRKLYVLAISGLVGIWIPGSHKITVQ
jgi:hypothetical protein